MRGVAAHTPENGVGWRRRPPPGGSTYSDRGEAEHAGLRRPSPLGIICPSSLPIPREGTGTPLQYSRLENPMDQKEKHQYSILTHIYGI